jgi:hypothetical protein
VLGDRDRLDLRERAHGVDEATADAHGGRGRQDHGELQLREAVDLLRFHAPASLGPAPKDTQAAARGVHEHAIEAARRHGKRRRVGDRRRDRAQTETRGRVAHETESARVRVERDDRAALPYLLACSGGLAAGSRRHVEHALARLRPQARDHGLARLVLRRRPPVGHGWEPCQVSGSAHHERLWMEGARSDLRAGAAELVDKVSGARPEGVRTQRDRRGLVRRLERSDRVLTPQIAHQPLDEPIRVRQLHGEVVRGRERRTDRRQRAQHGVHVPASTRRCDLHRLPHGRMHRYTLRELVRAQTQRGAHRRVERVDAAAAVRLEQRVQPPA